MKEFDIHHGMPSVEQALSQLDIFIKLSKKEKVIKIIHGYGSSGKGGKIKKAFQTRCIDFLDRGIIKAYIPGEAISLPMGYDQLIRKYKNLLSGDADFKRGNDGITYLFFD